jgi:c-di-GMP-binding flagellar brake protein YcgR
MIESSWFILPDGEECRSIGVKMDRENRRSPRFDCRGVAGVQKLPAAGTPTPARIENLSEGGCLMELQGPMMLDENEVVELTFEVHHMTFRVQGQVRAIRSAIHIGFQFRNMSEGRKTQILDLIEELEAAAQKRAENPQ